MQILIIFLIFMKKFSWKIFTTPNHLMTEQWWNFGMKKAGQVGFS